MRVTWRWSLNQNGGEKRVTCRRSLTQNGGEMRVTCRRSLTQNGGYMCVIICRRSLTQNGGYTCVIINRRSLTQTATRLTVVAVGMAALRAAKQALRRDVKRRVAALSEQEKQRQSAVVSQQVSLGAASLYKATVTASRTQTHTLLEQGRRQAFGAP